MIKACHFATRISQMLGPDRHGNLPLSVGYPPGNQDLPFVTQSVTRTGFGEMRGKNGTFGTIRLDAAATKQELVAVLMMLAVKTERDVTSGQPQV